MFGEVWSRDAIEREGENVLKFLSDVNTPLSMSEPMADGFIKRCERLLKNAGLASQDSSMCPVNFNMGYRESNRCSEVANYWRKAVGEALENARNKNNK